MDVWSVLDKFKFTREEEIEYRTRIENTARKNVVHHTNESTLTRMQKEMKKRDKAEKQAENYGTEIYCIIYKTFVITGSEVLLPQYLAEKNVDVQFLA